MLSFSLLYHPGISRVKPTPHDVPAALHLLRALLQEPGGIFALRPWFPATVLWDASHLSGWLTTTCSQAHRFSVPRKAVLFQKWHALHFLHCWSGLQTCFLSRCNYPSKPCSHPPCVLLFGSDTLVFKFWPHHLVAFQPGFLPFLKLIFLCRMRV